MFVVEKINSVVMRKRHVEKRMMNGCRVLDGVMLFLLDIDWVVKGFAQRSYIVYVSK